MTSQVVPTADAATDESARRVGSSGRRRRALTGALVGAVLLGAVGGVLAATADPEVSASALVQSYPDPAAVENPTTGAVDGDQAARNATYVETELVSLNSADLAAQVADAVGRPVDDVQLEAVRVGDSNVITITATAQTPSEAAAEAQSAADLYVAARQQRLADRITGLQGTVESQITANQQALDALPNPPTNGVDVNEQQRAALAQQNVELLGARDTLQRAAADTGQVAGVIQQATAQPSGALSTAVLTVVAAVLVGALLGGVLAPVVSSLRGRVRDAQDVTGLGVPVLSPTCRSPPAGGGRATCAGSCSCRPSSCPEAPSTAAASPSSAPAPVWGTTFTAVAHARHAALRRPTLLVVHDLDAAADLLGGLQEPTLLLLGARRDTAGHAVPDGRPTELPIRKVGTAPGLAVVVVPAGSSVDDLVPTGVVDAAAEAGWAVVVDSPPLDRSDEGLRAALQCGRPCWSPPPARAASTTSTGRCRSCTAPGPPRPASCSTTPSAGGPPRPGPDDARRTGTHGGGRAGHRAPGGPGRRGRRRPAGPGEHGRPGGPGRRPRLRHRPAAGDPAEERAGLPTNRG